MVFNVPTYSNRVFIGLSKNQSQLAIKIIANIEDYEQDNNIELIFGDIIVNPDSVNQDTNNPFGVMLLRTATSLDCVNVPDRLLIGDKQTSLFLAIPISRREYEIRQKMGHNALMEEFEIKQKDIFFDQ